MEKLFKMQQGDILINKIKSIPKGGKKLKHLILAEGEQTGHCHQIVSGITQLIVNDNFMFLKVLSDYAKLKHEEHREIDLPKGNYEIKRVREFDPFEDEIRLVQD